MNMQTKNLKPQKRTVTTPHIEVRLARLDEVEKLMNFLQVFFDASRWSDSLKYDRDKAWRFLHYAIGTGSTPYIIALEGDELVGVGSYHTFDVFTQPIGVLDECFVVPKYRRTDLGRRLVALIIDLAKADGCAVLNFPICSGMKEQNSLMNMVGRHFGAIPVGMIFRKVL